MTSASAAFSASSAVTRLNSVSCTARAMIVTMREKAGMAAALGGAKLAVLMNFEEHRC